MSTLSLHIENAFKWYINPDSNKNISSKILQTRDRFQGNLDNLFHEILKIGGSESEAALLLAIVGEIGNNAYDHNLGMWKDSAGCLFDYFHEGQTLNVILVDRGQGILNSLKRVVPNLASEKDALKIAFEKKISGRSPEKRGNGLKFVRAVINKNPKRGLFFHSGNASVFFGGKENDLKKILAPYLSSKAHGVFCLISWELT